MAHVETHEHLDHPIELPLIDLARLQRRVRVTEPVGGATDLPQEPRLLPVHDLRARRRRRSRRACRSRPRRDGSRHRGRARCRRAAPRGSRRPRAAGISSAARTDPARPRWLVGDDDPPIAERVPQELRGTVARRVVDGHDAHPRIGLRAECRQASAEPSGGVPYDEDDQDRGRVLRRGVGGRSSHAMRSRAARSLAGQDREQAEGGLTAPLHTSVRRALSACALRACEPPSSCVRPACEPPSSSARPACGEPRSSCVRPACEPRSSCVLPACGEPPSSCVRPASASRGLLACGRLAASRGLLPGCGLPRRGLLACGRLPASRGLACRGLLASRGLASCRLLASGRLAGRGLLASRGLPGCCHAALPSRFPWIYDAIRFRRRRSRSLIPPHTP